jgi:hypothetical protein
MHDRWKAERVGDDKRIIVAWIAKIPDERLLAFSHE